jgi:hypothetical protein
MFFTLGPEVGIKVLTASGVVNDSGKAQALYGYSMKSGGTAGVLTLFDGTSSVSPSTVAMDQTGVISSTVQNYFGCGIVFANGLYASFDANITRATFFVRQAMT